MTPAEVTQVSAVDARADHTPEDYELAKAFILSLYPEQKWLPEIPRLANVFATMRREHQKKCSEMHRRTQQAESEAVRTKTTLDNAVRSSHHSAVVLAIRVGLLRSQNTLLSKQLTNALTELTAIKARSFFARVFA